MGDFKSQMTPLIVTITGPSCSGKSTLEKALRKTHGFASMISATTRPARKGEVDGVDYDFRDEAWFKAEMPRLVESVKFNGNIYGLHADRALEATQGDKPAVVVVEPDGAGQIKNYCVGKLWQCLQIYLDGDRQMLMERMLERFLEDAGGTRESYAKRILSLTDKEFFWRKSRQWDHVMPTYTAQTQQAIEAYIVGHVALMRLNARMREGLVIA